MNRLNALCIVKTQLSRWAMGVICMADCTDGGVGVCEGCSWDSNGENG